MISNEELTRELLASGDIAHALVEGDGYHYQLIIVSDAFVGKSKVARQQWVYEKLNHHIRSGDLHAVNMQTWTASEWEKSELERQHG
jgi:acid stress-induced BolA-like protein IbaG/YrbA